MKKVTVLLAAAFLLSCSGCSWMGRTVGKAQGSIERGLDNFESGYHEGYKQDSPKQPKEKNENQKQPSQ